MPPQASSSDFSVPAMSGSVFFGDDDQSMIDDVEDEQGKYLADENTEEEIDDEYKANEELLHELAADEMSNEPSISDAFETNKGMLHESSTLIMSTPDAIKLCDEKLAAPKALMSISKTSSPTPLKKNPTSSPFNLLQTAVQNSAESKDPTYLHPQLDSAWSYNTWYNNVEVPTILQLLEEAGEDTAELKLTGKKHEIIKIVTGRRERRVAAGLLAPLPLNNRTEPKAKITLTREKGEMSKAAALLAKLMTTHPLGENRKKRNHNFASAGTKRVGTNGQLMPLVDVKSEKEGQTVTRDTSLTRSAGVQKSAYVASRERRVYLPVADRSSRKRYDITTLRAHFTALAQQVQEDEASNATKCDENQRYTILKRIPLPEGTQLIAHKLLQQRNLVRKWQAHPDFGHVRNDDTEKSKRNHEKLGVQLATAISREIDDGLDGMALAMSMVNDIFGIKGSA